jgi:hypothetical protein
MEPVAALDAPPQAPLLDNLQTLLSASPTPLTRHELLARWPGAAPREESLWRALTRGVEQGLFVVSGAGTADIHREIHDIEKEFAAAAEDGLENLRCRSSDRLSPD